MEQKDRYAIQLNYDGSFQIIDTQDEQVVIPGIKDEEVALYLYTQMNKEKDQDDY